jgi:hypothetical protein
MYGLLEVAASGSEQPLQITLDVEEIDLACGTAPLLGKSSAVSQRREFPRLTKSGHRAALRIAEEAASGLEQARPVLPCA